MTASSIMSLVLLLFITLTVKSRGEPISLSTIRYRFTTCGQEGRTGPEYELCLSEYNNTSILANPNNFFKLQSSADYFAGGQGFRIPTTGRYNVTVAGASGGRGICNTDKGKGLLWRGELNFVAGEEVLILVGQKGKSPCEEENFLGAGTLCQNPPLNETDSAVCNETWYSRLLQTVPDNIADDVYKNIGGGGGGGASLIRLANYTSDGPILKQFPLVVAPGGGGSACLAVYNVTNQIQATFPDNLPDLEQYKSFMNAKHSLFDPNDMNGLGTRGLIYMSSIFRGGAGGGYFTTRNSADVDGGYLNAAENFAEGGFDCSRQLFDLLTDVHSTDIHGGFGGGGGQCGGGGSGGGLSGGRSTGVDHSLPGQGGFYYRVGRITNDNQDEKDVVETSVSLNEFDDGFVEFVLGDCGCSDMCIIVESADTFECFCSDNETVLAPNGFDCAKDIVLDFNATSDAAVLIQGVTFTPVYLPQAISLFAISGAASMDNSTLCSMVFFGADSKPALATNVLTDRTSGNLDHLSVLYSDAASTYSQSAYHKYLPRAVTVTGGVLVSEGNCQLLMEQVNLTISTHNVSSIPVSAISLVQNHSENELISLAQTIFGLDTTTVPTGQDTTTATESTTKLFGESSEVVWSLIVVSVLFFVVLICVTLIVIIRYTWNKSRSGKLVIESQMPYIEASTGSMVPNAYYHAISVPSNDPFVPNQYVQACPPKKLDQHDYEIISFSDLDGSSTDRRTTDENQENAITASARYFHTKFGVTAPVHDFASYNRHRVGDLGQLWEYPRGNLVYLRELGEGQFGKVLLMRAKGIANFQGDIPVAVKTLSFRAPNMLQKFIEETNLMKKFCHANIVSLLGVSSHDVNEDSAPLMILEYMPYGDLHGFLKKNRPQPDEPSTITPAHFFSIGRDVAEALSFLSSQGYVHRDVAARNCLVGPDLSIKIADFGLSRAVQTKSYYRVEGKTILPVKWMAPESLIYGVFSAASDVWSFGVLLWEVVTFGDLPLDNLNTEEIIELAETKTLCHRRPENCPEEIHMVMCNCHQNNPTDRIGFEEILRNFSKDNIDDYFEKTVDSV